MKTFIILKLPILIVAEMNGLFNLLQRDAEGGDLLVINAKMGNV
ncbi:hypothetical protein HMPREF9372_1814 [Sporosarcina newyorkensis 2681]|uniref:Uncharacterized protein n=1 Tax=Sporosarcina newyorkensis 2681 TaxID=1027292 RepID=F9DSN3_9BACL|nr:hypothetical protein HMPREF9372_1814 [Sporosarcina newyorkensis 2681]